MKHMLSIVSCVLLLTVFGAAALSPDEEGEVIAYTLELDPLEFVTQLPSADDLERVAAAVGGAAADLDGIPIFVGRVESEVGMISVRLVRVPFEFGKEDFGALLALDDHGSFLAGTVVDDFGEPVEEWGSLFGSLEHYRIPKLVGARPRSHLGAVHRSAEESAHDPDAKLTLALLAVLDHMNEQASVFNMPEEMRTLSREEEARMMSEQYMAVLELTDDLAPLLGDSAEEFLRLALDSSERAAAAAEAFRTGDSARGARTRRRMLSNCSSCHRMPMENHGGRLLSEVFRDAREKRGIGDGYWQVGHDVRIHHADRRKLQRVADALRTAALLIDAAK